MRYVLLTVLGGLGWAYVTHSDVTKKSGQIRKNVTVAPLPTTIPDHGKFHNRLSIFIQCHSTTQGYMYVYIDQKARYFVNGTHTFNLTVPGTHTWDAFGSCTVG